MTTHNALYDQYPAHHRNFSNGENIKSRAVSLSSSLTQQTESGDPRIILAYLMLLVSVAVLTISGQFPWFASIMAAWIRFSALLFALKFTILSPSIEAYTTLSTSADGWITLVFFIGIGFVLATAVFIAAAVAIPLILDRDTDFITAIQTSYRAVMNNPAAMTLWAAAIVTLTAMVFHYEQWNPKNRYEDISVYTANATA